MPNPTPRDSRAREPGKRRALSSEQYSRLAGDLRQHRRADRGRDPRAADQLAELRRARGIALDPFLDRRFRILVATARQELDPQLLEVAGQAGAQQPLPLVGGNEAPDLALRPIEP